MLEHKQCLRPLYYSANVVEFALPTSYEKFEVPNPLTCPNWFRFNFIRHIPQNSPNPNDLRHDANQPCVSIKPTRQGRGVGVG